VPTPRRRSMLVGRAAGFADTMPGRWGVDRPYPRRIVPDRRWPPDQPALRAPIAPAACSSRGGNRLTVPPSTPPSAARAVEDGVRRRAIAAQRNGPRPRAPA
jgi:hypothetical protein